MVASAMAMTTASTAAMPVAVPTPTRNSTRNAPVDVSAGGHHAREAHEGEGHDAGDDERDTRALQALRHLRLRHLLPDARHGDDGEHPPQAAAEAVGHRGDERVLPDDHEEHRTEDRAVHGDERQED